ncbi:hypothetical protein LSCM1_06349 [Leishmania martiniquensis]|uniref:BRCA2 OB1 domain-containing protein n=1 Tax=Leishmania martiniquensis TaxID=1580590 RepID=A0A836KML0_9TRYP|nr:hypothetical protein LSCM1_06349 [Leishmania martiniquensis]
MKGIACPHCTFINPPNKVKCGVCLRLLRKRERNAGDSTASAVEEQPMGLHSPLAASLERTPSTPLNEHESPATDATKVRGTQEESPVLPVEPESSTAAMIQAVQPAWVEGTTTAPPEVPTLFTTASGKPVTVRRESLQKVADRLGLLTTPEMEGCVPTLFETASGKPVTVQRRSLDKAKASMDGLRADTASSATAPAPSSIPIGAAARVPTAPLRSPADHLKLMPLSSENEFVSSGAVRSTGPPRQPAIAEPPSTGLATSAPEHPLRIRAPYGVGDRRRGFVPPQQRPNAQVLAKLSHPAPPAQATRLTALRFNPDACTCRSIIPSPSLPSITSLVFLFTGSDCGSVLAALLGVSSSETVQLGHWHALLLKLGASPKHCTMQWCRHALMSAMARVHFMTTAPSGALSSAFSPLTVLLCIMQMYNTEMVNGERPALRKIVEGDISSASLAVLYVGSVCEERSSPHMRVVTLCDGIYHLKVACDVPLSRLIREGVLRPGQRMAVCGAKSLLHGQCVPTECDGQVILSINYNCVRAVSQQTPLGVCHGEPLPLPLPLVHPLGGLVPAIEGVVARVLPSFFISQEADETPATADGARQARHRIVKTVRNTHSQLQASDRLRAEAVAPAESEAAESRPLLRVTSLLLVKDCAEALVQQWETVDEEALLNDDGEGCASLPVEGSWITLYAVNPAKSRTAAAPFSRAKLFFSSRKLHYVPSNKPLQHMRCIWQAATDYSSTTGIGDVADVCGLYMGSHRNEQGTFALLLLRGDTYALLQILVPSAGRVLSLPMPKTERLPVLILNATFLTGADSVAGSDCCRLFANEYTALLQRSTQANLKGALGAAAQLRGLVDAAPQKYAARRAEVFRCLDDIGSSTSWGLGSGTTVCHRDAPPIPEVPLDVCPEAPRTNPTAVATSPIPPQREGRLPYYLRQPNGSGRTAQSRGVHIPSAAPLTSIGSIAMHGPYRATSTHSGLREPLIRPSNVAAAARSRHYGNIADLMFLCDSHLNRRAWHPLKDPLQVTHEGAARRDDGFKHVQLCWRLSADSADDMACRVEERSLFTAILESVLPLQELCSVIADDQHIDVSLARSERILEWRRQDSPSVWWRLFLDSRLLGAPADLDGASSQYLWWLPAEWAEAMRVVSVKLQPAFFFFSLSGELLRHAHLISDCCNVAELPCD